MESDSDDPGPATIILRRMAGGDRDAPEQLLRLVHGELHALAERAMRGQGAHTLQPTALVNEACLRLLGPSEQRWDGRSHFLGVAAKAMRSVLVDHARQRGSHKRGAQSQRLPIDAVLDVYERETPDLVELDEALTRLAAIDEQLGKIVELRFFGGLSVEETARLLEVSEPTIVRGWRVARLWLQRELAG